MKSICAMVAMVAIGLLVSQASASLVIDVRATSVTGSGTLVNGTNANVYVGDVIHFEAYAVVLGQTADRLEGLTNLYGGVVKTNTTNDLNGSWSNLALEGGFDSGSGATAGTAAYDLNGDGDIDIGSTVTSSPNGWIYARQSTMVTGYGNPSYSWEIYSFDYTVGSSDLNSQATIGWKIRPGSTAAVWKVDNTNKNPGTDTYAAGQMVTLTVVPEPATLALVGLGALALLRRPRRV